MEGKLKGWAITAIAVGGFIVATLLAYLVAWPQNQHMNAALTQFANIIALATAATVLLLAGVVWFATTYTMAQVRRIDEHIVGLLEHRPTDRQPEAPQAVDVAELAKIRAMIETLRVDQEELCEEVTQLRTANVKPFPRRSDLGHGQTMSH